DGSQGVTDHCLSRYYIGVQPAPGALYVPDDDSGTYAPTRGSETDTSTSSQQWTPAQPRTDAGPDDDAQIDRNDERNGEQDPRGTDARPTPDASETDSPESETGAATPTETADTTTPGAHPRRAHRRRGPADAARRDGPDASRLVRAADDGPRPDCHRGCRGVRATQPVRAHLGHVQRAFGTGGLHRVRPAPRLEQRIPRPAATLRL